MIETDVTVLGTAAQFGRPVTQQVAQQLVTRFAACLQSRLELAGEAATADAAPAAASDLSSGDTAKPVSVSILLRALVSPVARFFRGTDGLDMDDDTPPSGRATSTNEERASQ